MNSTLPSKVFVLALDGATFDLIRPWAEQGRLSLFAQLLKQGAWNEIKSTVPPITPVAWLTFATSKNPGRHGVYNFFQPVRKDYAAVMPIAPDVNTEMTIWEVLSERKRQVCVLNVPMTFPPKPVHGDLYAGLPMPGGNATHSYPAALHDELLAHGWDLRRNVGFSEGAYADFFEYLKALLTQRTDATVYLMKNRTWDFFMVHHLETDQVAHMYWRFWENEREDHPLHDAMLRLFQHVEQQIERVLQALPDDACLLIVSDHGVGPVHYHLHLNNWLIQEGLLHWKNNLSTRLRRLSYQLGLTPTNLYRHIPQKILERLTLGQTRAEFARIERDVQTKDGRRSLINQAFAALLRLPFLYLDDIDWAQSVAYSGDTTQNGLIYLNLKGREPQGTISPGEEYQKTRELIRQRLYAWVNPVTGAKMVERVCFREELYQGDQLALGPDIVVFYKEPDYESRKGAVFLSHKVVEPIKNAYATHRVMGMMLAVGAGIQPGAAQTNLTLADMAPFILYLMDEEIPADFEGRFPQELIDPALLAQRPPRWGAATLSQKPPAGATALSDSETKTILDQLRKLGYVE